MQAVESGPSIITIGLVVTGMICALGMVQKNKLNLKNIQKDQTQVTQIFEELKANFSLNNQFSPFCIMQKRLSELEKNQSQLKQEITQLEKTAHITQQEYIHLQDLAQHYLQTTQHLSYAMQRFLETPNQPVFQTSLGR
jgi:septation ring formation regulator EzrA